jgi:hypothetical protein
MKPKEQRAFLLTDPKRYKRAAIITRMRDAAILYEDSHDPKHIDGLEKLVHELRILHFENPEIHQCGRSTHPSTP